MGLPVNVFELFVLLKGKMNSVHLFQCFGILPEHKLCNQGHDMMLNI